MEAEAAEGTGGKVEEAKGEEVMLRGGLVDVLLLLLHALVIVVYHQI